MKVNEIFKSISGEAANAGYPTIFIRTYGCNLRCSYCDSMYALEGGEYKQMTPQEILEECLKLNVKRVIFTGGEPLIQPDASQLVDLLCDNEFTVEIETNGSVDLKAFHNKLKTHKTASISYTMDYKSISSDMSHKMLDSNLAFLNSRDCLKFVVGSWKDLEQMNSVLTLHELSFGKVKAQVFVSPIFGKIEPADIVNYILKNGLNYIRVQLQIHKIIWNPDKRGV